MAQLGSILFVLLRNYDDSDVNFNALYILKISGSLHKIGTFNIDSNIPLGMVLLTC